MDSESRDEEDRRSAVVERATYSGGGRLCM